jgi:predicted ATPase
VFLKSLKLTNFLSFGESSPALEFRPLTVVIGPNGSGKSNLIEALELLRAAPNDLRDFIRKGGGCREWAWKGSTSKPSKVTIEAVLENASDPFIGEPKQELRYLLSFYGDEKTPEVFWITDERLEKARVEPGQDTPDFYYRQKPLRGDPKGELFVNSEVRDIPINFGASIFAQLRDSFQYPELTYLGVTFPKIRVYRDWRLGRDTAPRLPQRADLPPTILAPDGSNLWLVLNNLRNNPGTKKQLQEALHAVYEGADDFGVDIVGGSVMGYINEGSYIVPATRLSDGTLHYLCLLAILLQPDPPPLICIEEPEIGLHPDVMPTLARLFQEAAERTQLIVTTHSDALIDALSDHVESVVVAEKGVEGTTLTQLDAEKLKPWLEQYRLGKLWTRGDIGGTRW